VKYSALLDNKIKEIEHFMSRIGKKEIIIPANVFVNFSNNIIIVKGIHGHLERSLPKSIEISILDNKLLVINSSMSKKRHAFHGLYRALIQNMLIGVDSMFKKILVVEGVGYKFQVNNDELFLHMGYSHTIKIKIPTDIQILAESLNKIIITGIDKQKVGLIASQIREIKPPEPYKGKGIRYADELILRKAGKRGK
jgi:large subunit ribosomal protein L6